MDKQNKILNKVTKVTSPLGQMGKTTIANNLAAMFAQKGYLTAVIELDRYTGISPYLNNTVNIHKEKSLKNALENSADEEILSNFVQSKHHEYLFTVSLRINNDLHDLHKFGMGQIERLLRVSRNKFDKIFIDVPMDYLDNGFFSALNFNPDQTLLVMNENIASWHTLKLYDVFLDSIKVGYKRIIPVVNSSHGFLENDFYKEYEKDMKVFSFDEIFILPYMVDVIRANNEGSLIGDITPSNKIEKKFTESIREIVDAIEFSKEEREMRKKKERKFQFFKRKAKVKESQPKKELIEEASENEE